MRYLLIITLITGLLMFLLCRSSKTTDAKRIGEILFFSSVLALLITTAPLTVAWLH